VSERVSAVFALCIICAAIGAGIDHYWPDLVTLVRSQLEGADTPSPATVEPATPILPEKKVEVLADTVRCDVRFTELGSPVSEYRSFFDKCMGSAAPSD
jgi:hypothetical protein